MANKKEPKSGKSSKFWIILVALLVPASAGATWYFVGGAPKGAVPEKKKEALYVALDPAFLVNLGDHMSGRYLQTDIQVMTRDPKTQEALGKHMPAIRNRMLLLLGQQIPQDLGARSGKEALQAKALAEVKQLLESEDQPHDVEAVIFTSFVTQ